ncbi:hypothetical protein [Massilia sp. IC2-476]|uniref:hypothetical protein n=1 Tax=Massilia sp. IC2-476 TaxID=2887199 RepID=UPI001D129AC8|nr:hypothetical protein [Massilia sp. IC2-476]MCC2971329.1 hypothetical protein [Massilia sp. IC2-476]
MKRFFPASVLVLLLALSPSAAAQNIPLGQAEPRQMTEEILHSYTVYPYQPAFLIETRPAAGVRDDVPESVVAGWIGAMRAGQVDAVAGFWDKASQRQIAERDKAMGKQPSDWVQQWKRLFGNSKVVLNHKIKYGKYWMIAYTALDPAGQVLIHETVALTNAEGKWRLTLALADNVVLNNWESGKTRVQRLAAPLFKSSAQ